MNTKHYTAWRFNHPDLDPGHSGLNLTPRQSIAMVTEDEAVRQAVLLLISTRPGERLMRPDYGCDIFQLVFSPNDDTTAAIAIHYVRQALLRWEPRIDIVSLDSRRDPANPTLLIITLEYQVRATKTNEQIELALDLSGEIA
ncbi:MAG: GPW/gp25 family protein [Anaerolineales bacterium]|nr:GPW/gp25 family protein [Anaerolineales bacterium]